MRNSIGVLYHWYVVYPYICIKICLYIYTDINIYIYASVSVFIDPSTHLSIDSSIWANLGGQMIYPNLHPPKQAWNAKIGGLYMFLLFQGGIFRFQPFVFRGVFINGCLETP